MLAAELRSSELRRGWCPGALRPMRTGDGLLVRLRIAGGILSAAMAREIAACARAYGNGAIDLSNRSNLHLRGVTEAGWPALIARLSECGLIDSDTDAESVRNVMASPLAGVDTSSLCDISPLVTALEARLTDDAGLHRLPPKFGFLVDDGGAPTLASVASDIRFDACRTTTGEVVFNVGLGGNAVTALRIGCCRPSELVDVAAALARTFIGLRAEQGDGMRRMAGLLERVGAEPFASTVPLVPRHMSIAWRTDPPPVLGFHAQENDAGFVGLAAAFGRWSAADLDRLAHFACAYGEGELRLTPWRAILVPNVPHANATMLLAEARVHFVIDADAPQLAIVACSGAPDCANATTRTREDAQMLAPLARRLAPAGVTLHVSGCAKGCARPEPTEVALVGREGMYDLVRRGRASDPPELTGLTFDEVRRVMEDLKREARS
jgi:precorrin-3B synthase